MGDLLIRLEELKKEIHKRGWFSSRHKKKLPVIPQKIGVITSPTGAVIQDILKVLTRRNPNFQLILNPVKVQGKGAAEEIAQAIEEMNKYSLAEVLIVGRGGGSIEDLWAFNEEVVATAIFNSKLPIVSAVGHETDHCIADYVADIRAPTPSAAAELVTINKAQELHTLNQWSQRFNQTLHTKVAHFKKQLTSLSRTPVLRSPYTLLAFPLQRLDELKFKLTNKITHTLKEKKLQLLSRERQAQALNPILTIQTLKQKNVSISCKAQSSVETAFSKIKSTI